MLRAPRRRCGGPTLRILVIGVDGAEPTPSVHPSGEPEEPTGVPAYFWYDMRRGSASSYPLRFSGKSSDIRAKNTEPLDSIQRRVHVRWRYVAAMRRLHRVMSDAC